MENYLLELIRENNRIIIPNFGAFIVSREKGQNILFNNFLSFNDGLLISHICAVEGIDSASATKKLEEYVSNIKNRLDEKGVYIIKGIGIFTKDDNGVLRFEQERRISDEETPGEITTPISPSRAGIDDEDLLDIEPGDVDEKHEAPIEKKPEEPKKKEEPAPHIPVPHTSSTGTTSPEPKADRINKTEAQEKNPDKGKPHSYSKTTVEEDRRPILPIWLIASIIIVLLAGIGLYLWFYTTAFSGTKEEKTEETVIEELIEEPQPIIDEFEPDPIVPTEPIVATRQHHIIIGSFEDEQKAQQMISQITNRGLTTASILPYQGRYLVSAEWHPSVNKALQRQEELLQELRMENWVLSLTVK